MVRRLLDEDGGFVRVRARDQDDNVPIQVAGLSLELARRLELPILVGVRGDDAGGELVARAGDGLDLRVGDNIEVDLQRGRGVQAVRDLRDELRGFGGVRGRNIPRRDRGRDGEANSLALDRELSDVLQADLGTSTRLQLAKLDAKDVRRGFLQENSSLAILYGKQKNLPLGNTKAYSLADINVILKEINLGTIGPIDRQCKSSFLL